MIFIYCSIGFAMGIFTSYYGPKKGIKTGFVPFNQRFIT